SRVGSLTTEGQAWRPWRRGPFPEAEETAGTPYRVMEAMKPPKKRAEDESPVKSSSMRTDLQRFRFLERQLGPLSSPRLILLTGAQQTWAALATPNPPESVLQLWRTLACCE